MSRGMGGTLIRNQKLATDGGNRGYQIENQPDIAYCISFGLYRECISGWRLNRDGDGPSGRKLTTQDSWWTK